jgi:hypothetical protein
MAPRLSTPLDSYGGLWNYLIVFSKIGGWMHIVRGTYKLKFQDDKAKCESREEVGKPID